MYIKFRKAKTMLCLGALLIFVNHALYAGAEQDLNEVQVLEKDFAGKMGVYAIDTNNGSVISHCADERFPIQSTVKFIAVAALLKNADESKNKKFLAEEIKYTKKDLVFWHPITGKYLNFGKMSLSGLSEAAMSYSDNTASNLIVNKLGGVEAVNSFAKKIGNNSFYLKNLEPNMNSNIDIKDDTSTPKDMALSVRAILLGKTLSEDSKEKLLAWMKNNTTGYKKIRAGLPAAWSAAEKTGGGGRVSNDIGIVWSPYCKPIVIAIYTIQKSKDSKPRHDILSSATEIILKHFSKNNKCFAQTEI